MPQKCNLKRKISLWLHNYVSIKNYIEWFCSKASTLMKCLTYPDFSFCYTFLHWYVSDVLAINLFFFKTPYGGVVLRGHQLENSNLTQSLYLRREDDALLKELLLKKTKKYTFPTIQNEVLKDIVQSIKGCQFFSIKAAESFDISNIDQFVIWIRCVDSNFERHKELIGLHLVSVANARNLPDILTISVSFLVCIEAILFLFVVKIYLRNCKYQIFQRQKPNHYRDVQLLHLKH